ncbi:MAG: hypothetical protein HC860_17365 [Alkalinema sp. RU_4_3]|nr:hypothetical protein [Alkalinema sp. RU_4_3]
MLLLLVNKSVSAQQDDVCFIQSSTGQKTSLDKLCQKLRGKIVSDFMWDEHNFDPRYVSKDAEGIWQVTIGAPYPFKHPDGSIVWTDGRVTHPNGITAKIITSPMVTLKVSSTIRRIK